MHFDMEVISKALEMLLDAILPVVAAFAVAWLRAQYEQARNNLSDSNRWKLDNAVRVAVYAAEQLKLSGVIDNKLDYAAQFVQSYVDRAGLTISVEERRALIEAAVLENFPKLPQL